MIRKVLLSLLSGFMCINGFAQQFDKKKLDNYFQALESNQKFMGTVAVSKNGAIIYSNSIGYANIEQQQKATEKSRYRIGSISKTFTTVLILQAMEEKKLDINQPIKSYFPSLKNADKISIKHLLGHRSGIHNFTDDTSYLHWNTKHQSEQQMLDIIARGGIDFEPDTKAQYSNSNFVLLSYILEKIYKKSYATLLQEKILQPIGLNDTYFTINPPKDPLECASYQFKEGWKPETVTDMSIPMGAGGIISTATDLTRFADALFNGKLLQPESLAIMTNIKDGFGSGLFQIPFYDKISYGHNGGIDGFTSVFSHFADGNISYALTSNGTNYNNNNISLAVLSAIFDKPYSIPNFSTFSINKEEREKYVGVYASKQIPLKITITNDLNNLMAQASGQSAFPLEATEKDKFRFEQAAIIIEFNPAEKSMVLQQGGGKFQFTKEQ